MAQATAAHSIAIRASAMPIRVAADSRSSEGDMTGEGWTGPAW